MEDTNAWISEIKSNYESQMEEQKLAWEKLGEKSIHHGYYDGEHDDLCSAIENMNRILAEYAEIRPNTEVLNLGCGAGGESVWLAKNRNASIVGVDISEQLLDVARDYAKEAGVADQCDFRRDDFHELSSIDDDSFDVVVGLQSISHASDYERVLNQIERVLRTDGQIVIADFFQSSTEDHGHRNSMLDEFDELIYQNTKVIDELEAILDDQHFQEIQIEDHTENVKKFEKLRGRIGYLQYPYNKLKSYFGKSTKEDVKKAKASFMGYRLLKKGVRRFYIVKARV